VIRPRFQLLSMRAFIRIAPKTARRTSHIRAKHDSTPNGSRSFANCAPRWAGYLPSIPPALANDPDAQVLSKAHGVGKITIAHLINRRLSHSAQTKDYEFSRATTQSGHQFSSASFFSSTFRRTTGHFANLCRNCCCD
jgi:Patatin phospholipase